MNTRHHLILNLRQIWRSLDIEDREIFAKDLSKRFHATWNWLILKFETNLEKPR